MPLRDFTVIGPVTAIIGTVTTIWLSLLTFPLAGWAFVKSIVSAASKPEPVIVTVEPMGPLVGLMLVIVGGALGSIVGVAVGVGPADATADAVAVGIADAVAVAVAVAEASGVGETIGVVDDTLVATLVGRTTGAGVSVELPPWQPTTLASNAKATNNEKRPRTNIDDPPSRRRCL